MYSKEKILEILEAYDLTKSLRSAAALTGCDHHTVARYVAARAAGLDPSAGGARATVSEPFVDKIHEWVDRSDGRIRADVVHEKLVAMGYPGSERTTRRVVAAVKEQWRRTSHRVYMPWITEPGLWLQWDYAAGPMLAGQRIVLFVAWLSWSRFRVVVPLRDRTMPSVIAALDATFRRLGGAPTFALTDNEKTVTDRHIAGIAVRNPQIVAVGHYYGLSIATCVPADPESKGGSESTVKLAKADLVPTEHNLLPDYESWDQLVAACDAFMDTVNGRVHRAIGERPVDRLEIERAHLHAVPADPFTAAFGETRAVGWSSTLNHRGARYSVPHQWVDQRVWVRVEGDQLVVVATPASGPVEIARHRLVGPGQVSHRPGPLPRAAHGPVASRTQGPHRGGGGVPPDRPGRGGLAGRSRRGRNTAGSNTRCAKRSSSPRCSIPPRSTGRSARPRSPPGSRPGICCRSCPPRHRPRPGRRRTTRCSPAPPRGVTSATPRGTDRGDQ